MLDVGFSEILLTSAIALIVLGPERLPKVARQVGNWMGRARAMARQLTEQLEREVSADELMKQTKSTGSNSGAAPAAPSSAPAAPSNAPAAPSSAPAAFDTSYTPDIPPPAAAPPPASAPAAAYSPETAATVHGADWHASPPENKPTNE
ncbi:MAG TPA: Sec-independent protein translocase protein TatB [Steroidobacteraceae bacterium]|nr:Sec-independent protein translocase protein TatB [Steroidobacteraceae bacterium]